MFPTHAGLEDQRSVPGDSQGLVQLASGSCWLMLGRGLSRNPLAGDGDSSSGDLADALLQDAEVGVSRPN